MSTPIELRLIRFYARSTEIDEIRVVHLTIPHVDVRLYFVYRNMLCFSKNNTGHIVCE